jgi:hypothetical protein
MCASGGVCEEKKRRASSLPLCLRHRLQSELGTII